MTGHSPISEAQERFRQAVSAHWTAIHNGTTQEADKHTDAANAQVAQWDAQGTTGDVLLPLLAEDQTPAVRCAAATYLVDRNHVTEALPVLEALADNDDIGLVAEDADDALLRWQRNNAG